MTTIPRKYITDARNQKQAVIIDLETFIRMESIIEDKGLAKFMEEAEEDDTLSGQEAKKYYALFKKSKMSRCQLAGIRNFFKGPCIIAQTIPFSYRAVGI